MNDARDTNTCVVALNPTVGQIFMKFSTSAIPLEAL